MEETISIKELFQTIKKRLWLIGVITLLLAILTAIVSYFVLTPVYSVKTQLLVNQAKSDQQLYNNNQVQTDIQLVETYSVIIKSPKILDEVKKELKLKQTVDTLNKQISVENTPNSQVVEISVKDESAKQAVLIANTTASVFKKEISNIMNVDNVSVLSKAALKAEMSPVQPKPLLNILIAIVAGVIIGGVLAFLLEYLDGTLKTEEDIEKYLGIPVMGVVMKIDTIPADTSHTTRSASASTSRVRGESIGS
ncbi:Wzz/FepE/Etk N-terminal domain-containing protein [Priestia megaterium]